MQEFDEIESSGLEIELRCPRCGPNTVLGQASGEIRESRCPECSGSHLAKEATDRVLSEFGSLLPAQRESICQLGARGDTRCPGCSAHAFSVDLQSVTVEICARCCTAWFDRGALFAMTGGQFGSRSGAGLPLAANAPAPVPRPRSPSVRTMPRTPSVIRTSSPQEPPPQVIAQRSVLVLAVPIVLFCVLGAGGYRVMHDRPSWLNRGATHEARGDEGGEAAALSAEALPALLPPLAVTNETSAVGAELVRDYVFGGRTLAWWTARLTKLKARPDEASKDTYALTKLRAEANGLSVSDSGREVVVVPSAELMAKIGTRLASR